MEQTTDYDIVMLGHVSKDIIIQGDKEERVVGGPVVYSSAAACRSGAGVLVITKCAPADEHHLAPIREAGATLIVQDSPTTTSIRNVYHSEDRERRTVTLLSRADPFTIEDVPGARAGVYYLAGLFVGELPSKLIPPLAELGDVALDAQGVLRTETDQGRLEFRDWPEKTKYLPSITYFKTDAAEAEILTGHSDRDRAALACLEMGPQEVMLTHNSEVIVATADGVFRCPLTPRNLSGRTGRGDTCFAAYLAWRIAHSVQESVDYAATLVSMKMERPGVFRDTVENVWARMPDR